MQSPHEHKETELDFSVNECQRPELDLLVRGRLSQCEVLRHLEPDRKSALLAMSSVFSAPAGFVLLHEGARPDHCYVLLSGEVSVWKSHSSPAGMCNAAAQEPVASQFGSELKRRLLSLDSVGPKLHYEKEILLSGSTSCGTSSPVPLSTASMADECESPPLCDIEADFGSLVANMLPGALVGDLALLEGSSQETTTSCATNCKLLLVNEHAFDLFLREGLEQMLKKEMRLLCKRVPGLQALPKAERTVAAKAFRKMSLPAGHTFLEQGERAKRSIYVILRGEVRLSCRDISKYSGLDVPGVHVQDMLGKGDFFGSMGAAARETFTARCSTACEVFCVDKDALRTLPKSMLCAIQEYLDQGKTVQVQQIKARPSVPCSESPKEPRSLSTSSAQCKRFQRCNFSPAAFAVKLPEGPRILPSRPKRPTWTGAGIKRLPGMPTSSLMELSK